MHSAHVSAFGEWLLKQLEGRYGSAAKIIEACLFAHLRQLSQLADFLTRKKFEEHFVKLKRAELLKQVKARDWTHWTSWVLTPYDIEDRGRGAATGVEAGGSKGDGNSDSNKGGQSGKPLGSADLKAMAAKGLRLAIKVATDEPEPELEPEPESEPELEPDT